MMKEWDVGLHIDLAFVDGLSWEAGVFLRSSLLPLSQPRLCFCRLYLGSGGSQWGLDRSWGL